MIRLAIGCVAAVLCLAVPAGNPDKPITDETLRITALKAIFPGMRISVERDLKGDDSPTTKAAPEEIVPQDALEREKVYRVVGGPTNEAEDCAAEDIVTRKVSDTRQLQFKLFRWPNEVDSGLLAVLQYGFPHANTAGACWSIGLLVHLVKPNDAWTVRDRYLLETWHHDLIDRVELLDLAGNGADRLVVDSDTGWAGSWASTEQVFDLSRGRFDEVLNLYSRLEGADGVYSQILDVGRTLSGHGREFCFAKTARFEDGKWFAPPRVTRPCYQAGEGVNPGRAAERNKMLVPLR